MAWREAVGEGFGPHREGEPAGLRRDIIDELTDHLDCAMRRELVAAPDERAAERKVLARFGDPRRIARRLWLDAMKETIMSQRIMLGVVVLLAVACVAASVFAWLSFQQGQQLNAALLARLEDLASRPAAVSGVPSELAVAKIRVVEEGEGGKPVARAWVRLKGNPFQESRTYTVEERTATDGVATLGPIRPGTYGLSVFTPARLTYEQRSPDVMLFAGRENEKVVVCPRGAGVVAPETDVRVSLAWPEDLAVEGVLTRCTFEPVPSHVKVDAFNWNRHWDSFWVTGTNEVVDGISRSMGLGGMDGEPGAVAIDGMERRLLMPVGVGQYRLRRITLWSASSAIPPALGAGFAVAPAGPTASVEGELWYKMRGQHEFDDDATPTFEARAGVVNEWKIDIPEGLLAKLREALAKQEGQSQPAPNSAKMGRGTPVVPRGGGIDLGMTSGDEEENK